MDDVAKFKTVCPHCDKPYTLAAKYQGKAVKCAACQGSFRAEPAAEAMPTVEPMVEAKPISRSRRLPAWVPLVGVAVVAVCVGIGIGMSRNNRPIDDGQFVKKEALIKALEDTRLELQAKAAAEQAQAKMQQPVQVVEGGKPPKPPATFESVWKEVIAIHNKLNELEPQQTEKRMPFVDDIHRLNSERPIRIARTNTEYLPYIVDELLEMNLVELARRYKRSTLLNASRAEHYLYYKMLSVTWNESVTAEQIITYAESCQMQHDAWDFAADTIIKGLSPSQRSLNFIRLFPGGADWWLKKQVK